MRSTDCAAATAAFIERAAAVSDAEADETEFNLPAATVDFNVGRALVRR
jgi:hypothetical protein